MTSAAPAWRAWPRARTCREARPQGNPPHAPLPAAGACSLLVSLWPVDDRATARLMESFYARITDPAASGDRALALQAAQAELRDWRAPDGTRPFAHPAYWASFALVGEAGGRGHTGDGP